MTTAAFHRLTIADIRHETADAVSIGFTVPPALRAAYRFTPGQYLTLRATIGNEDIRRPYSICSGLDDGELRVAIKHVEGGAFSGWANATLKPGDALEVMTPMGRFTLPPDPPRAATYAAFAAGSGITPILAIVKTILARQPASRVLLFYGNRTTRSIIFRDQLEDLKDRHMARLSVVHILSREQQDTAALNGHLDPAKLRLLLPAMAPPATIDHAFLCGPSGMIESLEPALRDMGLPRGRIHAEHFTPAPGAKLRPRPAAPAATAQAIATIILEGAHTEIPVAEGEAIIDAAIRAGLNPPYSCKGGMCCTCRARITGGAVNMDVNFSLEPWETEAGYVLTCQSHPTTPRVVVDYDAV